MNLYLKPWPFRPFRANIFRAPQNSSPPSLTLKATLGLCRSH